MSIGRNQLCPCGSGLKYKKCCLNKVYEIPKEDAVISAKELTLYDRNMTLLNGVFNIFGLAKLKTWPEVKKNVTTDKIKSMYQLVADLWHYKTDLKALVPEPDSKLRALYLGDIAPDLVVNSVFRYSLYADEIFVVSPFTNPRCIKKEHNPIENPGYFQTDALKLIFFAIQMYPWVEAGIVHLIPDPGEFDYQLRKTTWDMAKERSKNSGPTREDIAVELKRGEEEMKMQFLSSPDGFWIEMMRKDNPNISDKEVQDTLEYIKLQREQYPFIPDKTMDISGSQILISRAGVNLEMALYLCQMAGAFPYTNIKYRWKELQGVREELPEEAKIWTPVSKAFYNLDFKFLDNVDTSFACTMRKEGRLEGFRAYLRRIWMTLNEEEDWGKMKSKSRDFADELIDEFHKAEAEWQNIDRDLIKWMGGSIAMGVASGGATSLIDGKIGLAVGGAFAIKAITELLTAKMSRRSFRKKVPMSVMIDLQKHK